MAEWVPHHHPLPFLKIPANRGPHAGSRHHVPCRSPDEFTVSGPEPLTAFCCREDVFEEGGGGPPSVLTVYVDLRAAGDSSRGTQGRGISSKCLRGRSRGLESTVRGTHRGDLTGLWCSRASSKFHWNRGRPGESLAPRPRRRLWGGRNAASREETRGNSRRPIEGMGCGAPGRRVETRKGPRRTLVRVLDGPKAPRRATLELAFHE